MQQFATSPTITDTHTPYGIHSVSCHLTEVTYHLYASQLKPLLDLVTTEGSNAKLI